MRAAVVCMYQAKEIGVERAIALRDKLEIRDFYCIHCGDSVRAHKAGVGHSDAHFEHLKENDQCPYSRAGPNHVNVGGGDSLFEGLEGQRIEAVVNRSTRNRALVAAARQRDDNKCRACGFKMFSHGKYIIEVHHIRPVALGERISSVADLICLCPICHRVAHLDSPKPLGLEEIQKERVKADSP